MGEQPPEPTQPSDELLLYALLWKTLLLEQGGEISRESDAIRRAAADPRTVRLIVEPGKRLTVCLVMP